MSASLLDANGRTVRTVRNLGWLLRNSAHVESITITRPKRGTGAECRMVVALDALAPSGARSYVCDWGSARLCWDWLRNKPRFAGHWLYWFGTGPRQIDRGAAFPGTRGMPKPLPDSLYSPIRAERAPGHYRDWAAYRDAVGATTEREESLARVRWDEWCKQCARARAGV